MSDIFISYASGDRALALVPVVQLLERQGWTVWWDRTILPGKNFDEVIERALDDARCVVVVWSRESVGSQWVKSEAAEGARRNLVVPILLDPVKIPLEFRRIQTAQLPGWPGDPHEVEVRRLLESIATILGQSSGVATAGGGREDRTKLNRRPRKGRAPRPVIAGLAAALFLGLVSAVLHLAGVSPWTTGRPLPSSVSPTSIPASAFPSPTGNAEPPITQPHEASDLLTKFRSYPVAFRDVFMTNAANWEQRNDAVYFSEVGSGKLVMELRENRSTFQAVQGQAIGPDDDFLLEVSGRATAGEDYFYGLFWESDWSDTHTFVVSPGAQVFEAYWTEGWTTGGQRFGASKPIVDRTRSGEIQPGTGQNRLTVVRARGRLSFFVNDRLLFETAGRRMPVNRAGPTIGGQLRVEFDSIEVRKPG